MLPTVANMTQFYITNSKELGWVCLTICTLDGKSPSSITVNGEDAEC